MDGNDQRTDMNCVSVRPKIRVVKPLECEEVSGDPVDKKFIKIVDSDGNQSSFPALHQRFADCLVYVKYYPPPRNANGTLVDPQCKAMYDWLETVYTFEHNLRTVLKLPFHRFWATVIHEKGFHLMLESYLLHAPRFYDSPSLLFNDQVKESLNEIHKLVFKVHIRMSNFKESKKDHLTPQFFGQIIYDHYVFDVPKILDLCALYGSNSQIMREKLSIIIDTFFKHQNAYKDLQSAVLCLMSTLQRMQKELESAYGETPSNVANNSRVNSMKHTNMEDTIYFITDFAVSLSLFVSIYIPAAKLLHKHKFENIIVAFYETVFLALKYELDCRLENNSIDREIFEEFIRKLTICRHCCIKCFRDITVFSCFHPLFDQSVDNNTKSLLIDDYLESVATALSEKCFARDYFMKYPFLADLSALMENSDLTGFQNIDQTRIDYLLSATNCQEVNVTNGGNVNSLSHSNSFSDVNELKANNTQCKVKMCNVDIRCDMENDSCDGQDSIDKATLESCITNITDIFPDLGHGFIEACLERFNNDVERVVDALLTSNLPPSIDKLDRNLKLKPKKVPFPKFDDFVDVNIPNFRNTLPEGGHLRTQNKLKSSGFVEGEVEKECHASDIPLIAKKIKEPNSIPEIDEKTKTYVKLAALRIEEESLLENEYEDEYDDTYEESTAVLDNDYKFKSEAAERRNWNRK